jgi:hypothetical protein
MCAHGVRDVLAAPVRSARAGSYPYEQNTFLHVVPGNSVRPSSDARRVLLDRA